jgi:predicted nucleic acid-binding protein
MKGIADTGFIVAAGDRDDRHHQWAVSLAHSVTEPLLTCEAVLAEAAFHLKSSAYVLTLVESGIFHNCWSWGGAMLTAILIWPTCV